MLKPRISRTVLKSPQKPREGDSLRYLAWIRSFGCLACGKDAEAHHLLRSEDGHKGLSQKSEDRWAIPLCRKHHAEAHLGTIRPDDAGLGRDEAWLLETYRINARDLCKALWSTFNNENDPEERDRKGVRLIERARQ